MNRRRVLHAVGATLGLAGVAGCLGAATGDGSDDPSPTSTDPTTGDPGSGDATTGGPGTARPETTRGPGTTGESDGERPASDEFDPDVPVRAENEADGARTLDLTVSQGGSVVHEATYDLAAWRERTVYNLRETDPDGVERFTVEAGIGDWTDSVAVETSGCYGHVLVVVREDEEPFLTYSVC